MAQYLLASDVARIVGVTPATIRTAAKSGKLQTAAVTESKVRLFLRQHVDEFIADRAKRKEFRYKKP